MSLWLHGSILSPHLQHTPVLASLAQIGPRSGVLSPTSLASSMWLSWTQRSRIYCGCPVPAAVIAPYTTHQGMACKLSEWRDRLPATLPWPRVFARSGFNACVIEETAWRLWLIFRGTWWDPALCFRHAWDPGSCWPCTRCDACCIRSTIQTQVVEIARIMLEWLSGCPGAWCQACILSCHRPQHGYPTLRFCQMSFPWWNAIQLGWAPEKICLLFSHWWPKKLQLDLFPWFHRLWRVSSRDTLEWQWAN